jgi:DNA-binding PadR family transcriptional regulator
MSDQPLTPAVFHVLLALQDGARHGYAIMQEAAATAGLTMGPGTVYGTLQRLEESGLVVEAPAQAGESDPRRRYWQLTIAGEARLRAEAGRIAALTDLLRDRNLAPRGT